MTAKAYAKVWVHPFFSVIQHCLYELYGLEKLASQDKFPQ